MMLGFLDNVLELPNSAWSRLGISPNLEARGDNFGTRSCDRKSGFLRNFKFITPLILLMGFCFYNAK